MSVIGIDIGNLDCCIAQAKRGGIDIILNENSNRKNPNLICFTDKQRHIGEAAVSLQRMNFKNTLSDIKLFIGKKYKDCDLSHCAFQTCELKNGDIGLIVNYDDNKITLTCEQALAMVLNKMDHIVAASNDKIKSAFTVLSVPGYFTDLQRRAVLNAAQIAGMTCLRILNEHTAVALGYGIYKHARNLFHESEPQHIMFVDMGNTCYTVSVVAFVQGKLQVKSVAYDKNLGGRDFDLAICNHAAKEFMEKRKVNPMNDPKARLKLLAAAEKAKKNLSPQGVNATNINVECLVEEWDYNSKLEIEEFENLIAPLLKRLEAPVLNALKDAGLEKSQISEVEIVGGGTRVASVKRFLSNILDLDKDKPNMGLSTTLNADEAVARGCALQCAILSPLFKVKEFEIQDIISFPVRVTWDKDSLAHEAQDGGLDEDVDGDSTMGVSVEKDSNSLVIFTRKDDFPKTKRITLRRAKTFEVCAVYEENDSPYLSSNTPREIAKYQVSGIPQSDEMPKIRVHLKQDINGIFSVSSSQYMQEIKEVCEQPTSEKEEEKKDGKKEEQKQEGGEQEPKKKRFRRVELEIKETVGGMTTAEINSALEQELKMAQQDRVIEETADKRNELESYIYEMRNHLGDKYSDFITNEDREAFENKLQESEAWLYSDEGFENVKSVYQEKLDNLHKLGNPLEYRLGESIELPIASAEFSNLVEDYKTRSNGSDEKYAHWTDEECDKVRNQCSDSEKWLYDQMALQNETKRTQDPILTSKIIREKLSCLRSACMPIINKPKPIPKVEVPATEEKTSESCNQPSADAETEKMDLD